MTDLTTTAAAAAPGSFSAGRVLGRAFSLLVRRFWSLILLLGLIVVPFVVANMFLFPATLRPATRIGGRVILPAHAEAALTPSLLLGLAVLLLVGLAHAAIIDAAAEELRGRPFVLVRSLRRSVIRALPILVLLIAMMILFTLGTILLVVPGLWFIVVCYFALAACIIERLGPIASLKRSAALTKGHRWQVFGIFLVVTIGAVLLQAVATTGFVALGHPVAGRVLGALSQILVNAYYPLVLAVGFYDLRVARDGIGIEGIPSVFD